MCGMQYLPVCYPDGSEARIGDVLQLRGERSTVEDVITERNFAQWGLDRRGVMLLNASFGRIFIRSSDFEDEEVVFVSRGA